MLIKKRILKELYNITKKDIIINDDKIKIIENGFYLEIKISNNKGNSVIQYHELKEFIKIKSLYINVPTQITNYNITVKRPYSQNLNKYFESKLELRNYIKQYLKNNKKNKILNINSDFNKINFPFKYNVLKALYRFLFLVSSWNIYIDSYVDYTEFRDLNCNFIFILERNI